MNHEKVTERERLAWGIAEAAEAICASPGFIRKAIDGKVPGAPQLKVTRVGRRTLILDRDLREWIGDRDAEAA